MILYKLMAYIFIWVTRILIYWGIYKTMKDENLVKDNYYCSYIYQPEV